MPAGQKRTNPHEHLKRSFKGKRTGEDTEMHWLSFDNTAVRINFQLTKATRTDDIRQIHIAVRYIDSKRIKINAACPDDKWILNGPQRPRRKFPDVIGR